MKYREKNGKYIVEKDGVYFSMTDAQVREMRDLCNGILGEYAMVVSEETRKWLATPIDD